MKDTQLSRVLDAVTRGYDCTVRIRAETGIGTMQVARALLTLLEDKIVERGPLERRGPGRPGFRYRLRAARS
jgi:predicted ArsR family transcriptional regulator